MSLSIEKQIINTIENSNNILLTVAEEYSGDSLCCALSFYNYISEIHKSGSVDLILPQKPKKIYSFLPKIDDVTFEYDKIKRLVFDVDTSRTKVKEIDYTEESEKLKIFLTSTPHEIKPQEVTVYYGDYYDLIIVFNSPDFKSLGDVFSRNAEFFHKTPIINIDFNPANDRYGQINFVEAKFGSMSEMIFDFFDSTDSYISKEVADCIFSGLVFATKGFTNNKVTPSCLSIASKLIQLGAEREKIISNIYQTKSISLLKIWGSILSQMKYDENSKMAWSYVDVDSDDVSNIGISELIEEIISRSPEVEVVVLFHGLGENLFRVYVYSNHKYNSFDLVKGLVEKAEISGDNDLLCFEFRGVKSDSQINILETIKRNLHLPI